MSDKSLFTDDEWRAVVEAPLYISLAMVAVGQHGPLSMVKEAAATARALVKPGDRGAADAIVAQIAKEADDHDTRHDVSTHRGKSPEEMVELALTHLGSAAGALGKLPADEARHVGEWFVDIARAVGDASKGRSDAEQQTIDRIAGVLGVAAG